MTPSPSSSGDSPLPKKHRPQLGELAQETTEKDLWDFEEDLDDMDEPADGGASGDEPRAGQEPEIPRTRKTGLPEARAKKRAVDAEEGSDHIRVNVNRPKPKMRRGIPSPDQSQPEDVFDELDQWDEGIHRKGETVGPSETEPPADEPEVSTATDGKAETEPPVAAEEPARDETTSDEAVTTEPGTRTEPAAESPAEPTQEELDEFNPHAPKEGKPASLHPHLSLSKLERIGLISLAVVLVLSAGLAYWFSINRIPSGRETLSERDFPIRGERVTVKSVETYWREPVTEGPEADTVRRGTRLIPVIRFTSEAKPATLRIVFRDHDGEAVGDITNQDARSGEMEIAATAGFEELGMHAAYQTGSDEPWTVEVLEGKPGSARSEEFTRLFEIEISALRR